jgi:outer membrane protein assembly factor BamB
MRVSNFLAGMLFFGGLLVISATAQAQDWPQWRGPNRDNKVVGFNAPVTWPKILTQKWKVVAGQGDSSPVLVGKKIYVFGRQGGDEVIQCLDADTGKQLWDNKYPVQLITGGPGGIHAGPRATPVVADGKVCTFGARGMLSCLDAETGKLVWRKETTGTPVFFTAASPIIVDKICIAYSGGSGKGEIVAYDLADGSAKWTWNGEAPGYGSPVVMDMDGVKALVTLTEKSHIGLGIVDGKLLWQGPLGKFAMNTATPIVDGQKLIISNTGIGTIALKVEKHGGEFKTKELWRAKLGTSRFNTPVLRDGMIYGITGAGGKGSGSFFCMNAENGMPVWTDSARHGETGAILSAGAVLLAITDDTNLVVLRPGTKQYTELATFKVAETPTWSYPIVAGNRVYVKDQNSLTLWSIE